MLQQKRRHSVLAIRVALLAVFYVVSVAMPVACNETPLTSFIESSSIGWIDWDKGLIYGIGRGYLDKNNSRPQAMAAARVVAAGNIVKQAAALKVDDHRTLKAMWNGNFVMRLNAHLRTRTHEANLKKERNRHYYEVVEVASTTGVEGLTAKFVSRLKSSSDTSLAPPQPSGDGLPDDEGAPWLALDASGLDGLDGVNPALFPKIVTADGTVVYDLRQVLEAALLKRGMVNTLSVMQRNCSPSPPCWPL